MSQFKLISSVQALNTVPVRKYVSQRTGLTVVIGDVQGIYVEGTYLVVTEPDNDDGYPHALEHIVFNGSQKYPYKDILHKLTERSVASSYIDHTTFNFTVVGQDAALALLPVYTDHILWPLLSEEGFITDVHHITGEGENSGLVYDEMKDGECGAFYKRCLTRLMSEIYANSGFAFDYAGKSACIRTMNNTKVKEFHTKFFRPENITLILTGQLDHVAVFNALSKVEDDIIAKWISEPLKTYVKPWQKIPKPNYGEYTEYWPAEADHEEVHILIGWRGPTMTSPASCKELKACEFIMDYLCHHTNGPLKKRLVNNKDPLAGIVSCNIYENKVSTLCIEIFDIPSDKFQTVRDETIACIKSVRNGDIVLNIEDINKQVRRDLMDFRVCVENSHHYELLKLCLVDAIHSENDDNFSSVMNPQIWLQQLLKEPAAFWLDLFKKYFTDDVVIVFGVPSVELKTRIEEEEKKRIEDQKAQLGIEGLAEKAELLKKAKEFSQRPLPAGTLDLVPLPTGIPRMFNTSMWSSDSEPCPHFDLKDLPIYARVQNLKTLLVHIHIILDTTAVDQITRKWIPIFLASIGECSIRHGDTIIPREATISKRQKIVESFSKEIGFKDGEVTTLANFVHLSFEIFPEDYEETVNFIHDVLYNAEMTSAELFDIVRKMQQTEVEFSTPQTLLKGYARDRLYSKDSNAYWSFTHIQSTVLKEIMEKLNNNNEQVLVEARTAYGNMMQRLWLHLAADFDQYKLSSVPWKYFGRRESSVQPIELPYLYWDAELMSNWGGGLVVALEGVDKPYLTLLSPGPIGHAPQDVGPLLLASCYFAQYWLNELGCNLDFNPSPNESCLMLSLYEVEDAALAYGKLKKILNNYLADNNTNEEKFKLAKKYALHRALNCKRPKGVIYSMIINYMHRVDENYSRDLVKAISESSLESIHAVAARWFPSMLDTSKTKITVLCIPEKVIQVQTAFNELGVKLEACESQILAKKRES